MGTNDNPEISYEVFVEKYKPIENTFVQEAPFDGKMFETFGSEIDYVKKQNINKIWTFIDEDGISIITPGFWRINRIGYFVTEEPWVSKNIIVNVE